ncbi:hypothetical protein BDB01DRAFT_834790 [Pilobolus umbonatus]|nr:hypothetical protein BDB01DRAFT_834790 [Pilobolus umbonatus]
MNEQPPIWAYTKLHETHSTIHRQVPRKSNIDIQRRIRLYEHKYNDCMKKESHLLSWMISTQSKPMSTAFLEGPRRLYQSRSHENTKRPEKNELCHNEVPSKSSITNLIKKAASFGLRSSSSFSYGLRKQSDTCSSSSNSRLSANLASLSIKSFEIKDQANTTEDHSLSQHQITSLEKDDVCNSPASLSSKRSSFMSSFQKADKFEINQPNNISSPIQQDNINHLSSSPHRISINFGGFLKMGDPSLGIEGDQVTQKKKKRASLLMAPSLSTIRTLSQKSHFLKRQSMLS